jgi:predicted Ser/Thr protein kinase
MTDRPTLFIGIPKELVQNLRLHESDVPIRHVGRCLPMAEIHRYFNKEIARGAYGVTMAACSNAVEQDCKYVAKVVKLTDKAAERAFRLECAFSNHASENGYGPQVIRCIVCQTNDIPIGILVMERLTKVLTTELARLTTHQCRDIFERIQQMHRSGVWHSDLSAANIMFNSLGKARIIDFGMAWPFMGPIPHVLQMVDYVSWIEPACFANEQGSICAAHPGVTEEIRRFLRKELFPAAFAPGWKDLYSAALKMRVLDKQQYVECQHKQIVLDYPPLNSTLMYEIAAKALPVPAIQTIGPTVLANRSAYLVCDQSASAKGTRHIYNLLVSRI